MDWDGHVILMWIALVFAIIFTFTMASVIGYVAFLAYVPWGLVTGSLVYRLAKSR